MLLENMQHLHPHITFYCEIIFLSWGGRILHNIESLMVLILMEYLASFIPHYSGGITMLLCISCTETFNEIFGIAFFVVSINRDIKTII